MAEKALFVVTPAGLDNMSFQLCVRHLESKKGGKGIFETGIPVKSGFKSTFSSRCLWNFCPDLISSEIRPILERDLCNGSNTLQNDHRVFSNFKYSLNPRRWWLLVSKGGDKPRAVKGLPLKETLELRNGVNKISRCNADCGGIAMVINADSHIKVMQVLRCIRKIPRMRSVVVPYTMLITGIRDTYTGKYLRYKSPGLQGRNMTTYAEVKS